MFSAGTVRRRPGVSTGVIAGVVVVVIVVAAVGVYFAFVPAGGKSTASAVQTIKIGSSSSVGQYLENSTGFTLYMFARDRPGSGASACSGACASVWPPFYAGSLSLPSALSSANFTTITLSDGNKQTAYNGWPLYYYVGDTKAGSVTGEGTDQFNGLWYAMPPDLQQSGGQIVNGSSYSVGVAYKPSVGVYLTNSAGFTLYFRSTDTPNSGETTCTTSLCETNWPAFYAATLTLPPGLRLSSFGSITAYNSTKITTFDGYALFTFIHDSAPGDIAGEGVGGFYAATLPTAAAPSSTSTSTT
ncbi:MAG: hypothetical protein JRN21_01070 [Nitrososphaerota archaeon]|nr:hypothetical protein [Nitrososphaerota archaeon]